MTPEEANHATARLLATYSKDPLGYVEVFYPWGVEGTELEHHKGPRQWQREELDRLGEHLRGPNWDQPFKLAIASGHGIGKSAFISWIADWGITTMVDAKGVVTANTENQLRTKTWPELRKWTRMLAVADHFRVDNTVLRSVDPDLEGTWRFDLIPWSENNTDAFQGLHNERKRLLILFDEGSAIASKIYEVTQGALTDELTEIIWVVLGNPTTPVGYFFDIVSGKLKHRWHHRQIDSRTVAGINKKQLDEWVSDHGEDSDFVRVRVRGLFPRSGSNQLISHELVTRAQQRDDIAPRLSDPLIFGLDVARFGDDASVLYTRKGVVAGVHGSPWSWRGLDTVTLARRVADKIIELNPQYVNIDGGGVGGGVVDQLRSMGYFVNEVPFGGSATNRDFANKRAEMWCDMRDWLSGEVAIPWSDNDLASELTAQTYTYREGKNNDLLLTSKADMKREGLASPDFADALALTFAMPVNPVTDVSRGLKDAGKVKQEYVRGWE